MEFVWVFNCGQQGYPGGVFSRLDTAESWIVKHSLSGMLTKSSRHCEENYISMDITEIGYLSFFVRFFLHLLFTLGFGNTVIVFDRQNIAV